ncbi:cobalt-factor II C(20)-methyltransferase [Halobellus limi]|uniref:Cobalt-factor II C(20)-methyltransferase n=1 Tax=Halobellus limi TaxID=699433 RepID=A0A1H5VI20_9EURY|nr:cobalt-factor II C(20)-methyltransferase [Halobellus limi]QCC46706.1 cobalt-factor II C(20)-methyltransferase [Halobellus limi]SEF87015.1 precorrin-2/cobalt-factor-2 C20-methyltransferase [Halobellus limi]
MTLYGVGLGPGDADLVTVRGRRVLEEADVVYSPGRLSRSVATEHVPEARIGDVDFPMTRDEEELRRAWKAAAAEIAPRARDGTAAFVTLGDPNVYSTFGHLRRTLAAFHPDVGVEVVPGVSAVTAFTTALGVEIASGSSIALREAARGASPTGPDRMVLFKVTDVPVTHEGLVDAGYDVVYGRRLYMQQGETVVTDDPEALADRDYYTLAYAEKRGLDPRPATAAFDDGAETESEPAAHTDGGVEPTAQTDWGAESTADAATASDIASVERAEGEACGDAVREGPSR